MWNPLLGVLLLLSSSSWGYIIKQDNNLLFYFEKTVVRILSKAAGPGSEPLSVLEYNSNNTVIKYDVDKFSDTVINITLNFNRNDQNARETIPTFSLKLSLLETPRKYVILSDVIANMPSSMFQGVDSMRLLSAIPLETPKDRSFHCSRFGKLYPDYDANLKLINNTLDVEFFGLQLQAFNGAPSDSFGESYDCVGYFTAGIWSGIFVAIILISVITWGLAMIMDIKTNDKFDDPKSKPISFGGPE